MTEPTWEELAHRASDLCEMLWRRFLFCFLVALGELAIIVWLVWID